jgi:hypothetical protein
VKIAQNLNKITKNCILKIKTERKHFSVATGGPQPASALCSRYYLPPSLAAQPECGPWPASSRR